MELKLNPLCTPFDLESTLTCGQLFRWEKREDSWCGVIEERVLEVWQKGHTLTFEGAHTEFIKSYFRLDDDLPLIISEIGRDPQIQRAVQAFPGLRLARQNPWECLISYICATYKNIPAIRNMILRLSKKFGCQIVHRGQIFYGFPEPEALAKASISELRSCGLGFRAIRVREAARKINDEETDLEQLRKADYAAARVELMKIPGVGNKVADCVLLFSLGKLEAFPIDVRIKRIVEEHYSDHFDRLFITRISETNSLPKKAYDRIGSFARSHFGRYAGYAQEYLYHFAGNHQA